MIANLPPGTYTLSVGLYNLDTGERLPVRAGDVPQGDQSRPPAALRVVHLDFHRGGAVRGNPITGREAYPTSPTGCCRGTRTVCLDQVQVGNIRDHLAPQRLDAMGVRDLRAEHEAHGVAQAAIAIGHTFEDFCADPQAYHRSEQLTAMQIAAQGLITFAERHAGPRQVGHAAGLPDERPAFTINQVCGSGLRAVALAHQAIQLGDVCAVSIRGRGAS